MSVELVAKNRDVLSLGVANGTWFHLLKHTRIGDVCGQAITNDPIDISSVQAHACAEVMKDFAPPPGWGLIGENGGEKMKQLFIKFFNDCNGFTTR